MGLVACITILLFSFSLSFAYRDGDVRLVNSIYYGEGRVEVFYQGSWGTICQKGWGLADAEVICRQLGFRNGAQRELNQARFGQGGGAVLLSDVRCQGNEDNLLGCDNVVDNWKSNDCDHGGDAGVRCNAPNYKGCFPVRAIFGEKAVNSMVMTFEFCYDFCKGYQFFWKHDGNGCRCGNTLGSQPSTDFGQCTTQCAGDSDWICGGQGFAAVYGAQVELPFIASNGFPGRFNEDVNNNLVKEFVPRGSPDYIYIRVHQFDLLSISLEAFLRNVSTNIMKGSDNYWISVGSNSLQIQLEDTRIGPNGLLLEFGEGHFCPQPMFISNGLFSTESLPPFTVGNQFDVVCNSRYIPFDSTVFCRADGTVNQPIRCDAGFSTTTNLPQTPAVQSSSMAPNTPVRTFPRNPPIITAPGLCSVPVVTNGNVNGTAIRDVVSVGTVLSVSCNPIFEAVEDTSTCQRNGTFIPTPECRMNQTTFIIVLVAASVAAIFILILVAILCLLAFCFSKKRKRRVRDHKRRSQQEGGDFSSPYGGPPPITENDDTDTIIQLPGEEDLPPPEDDISLNEDRPPQPIPENSETNGLGEEEADALQGLNDVVQDMELQQLYGQVLRPTIPASSGFGGHFARP